MTKGKGNGHGGGDLIVNLHGEVMKLRETLARQHQEQQRWNRDMEHRFREMATATGRYHRETDGHLVRIARMIGHLGDRVSDHERRLSAVEAKVG